jgi:type I restriction enzyme R subunit
VLLARLQSDKADGGVDLSGAVALTHYRLSTDGAESIELKAGDGKPLPPISGGETRGGQGEIPMSALAELIEVFNERYGQELGDADALRVVSEVRDTVRDANPELADQAQANSRGDFVAERDELLIDAALSVGTDRERQAALLKALLDDDDFRTRAGELIFGSIYDAYAGGR